MQRSNKRKKRGTRNNYVKKRGKKEIKKQRKIDRKNLMHVLPQCDKCSLCYNCYCTVERDKNYNSCERVQKEQEKCLILKG